MHVGNKFSTLNRLLHTDRLIPWLLLAHLGLLLACLLGAAPVQAQMPVTTLRAELSNGYQLQRHYAGEVEAGQTSTLAFRPSGTLQQVHVEAGDHVSAGDLLAELNPAPIRARRAQAQAQLQLAQARVTALKASRELAATTAERQQRLLERGHGSRQRVDETRLERARLDAELDVAQAEVAQAHAALDAAQLELDDSRLYAPYDGQIQARLADVGSMLAPGTPALRLVANGRRKARVGLPADATEALQPGAPYRFHYGSQRLQGRFLHLLPEAERNNRTLIALFELQTGTGSPPVAGSMIELSLTREISSPGFWLPLAALSEAQRGLWSVFVVQHNDGGARVRRQLVEVLHTDGDRVFVRGTLNDGDRVVATGTQRIVPGQRVRLDDAP